MKTNFTVIGRKFDDKDSAILFAEQKSFELQRNIKVETVAKFEYWTAPYQHVVFVAKFEEIKS